MENLQPLQTSLAPEPTTLYYSSPTPSSLFLIVQDGKGFSTNIPGKCCCCTRTDIIGVGAGADPVVSTDTGVACCTHTDTIAIDSCTANSLLKKASQTSLLEIFHIVKILTQIPPYQSQSPVLVADLRRKKISTVFRKDKQKLNRSPEGYFENLEGKRTITPDFSLSLSYYVPSESETSSEFDDKPDSSQAKLVAVSSSLLPPPRTSTEPSAQPSEVRGRKRKRSEEGELEKESQAAEEKRRSFESFWELGDYNKQNVFIRSSVMCRKVERKRARDGSGSEKAISYSYILRDGAKCKTLCEKYFLDTLQLSHGRVYRCIS
ncbi:unnamed protein product [Timema podura]|uniref:Uncharacterized protein n=1 Tax=Timema podura TaxID=61482 RepID=A0ABN7NUM2_TIMPD|nr:unnamed protein product [Timema podura]